MTLEEVEIELCISKQTGGVFVEMQECDGPIVEGTWPALNKARYATQLLEERCQSLQRFG